MCQANVYLDEQEIMEEVIWLEPVEGGFQMRTLFGESREVKGQLVSIDMLKHRVMLTTEPDNPAPDTPEGELP